MTARVSTKGVAHVLAPGKKARQKRIMPKVPILSSVATRSEEAPGRACSAVSGSQVCTGTIGALIAKAMKKAAKSQRSVPVPIGRPVRSEVSRLGAPRPADSAYMPMTPANRTRPPRRL